MTAKHANILPDFVTHHINTCKEKALILDSPRKNGATGMYQTVTAHPLSFADFNRSCGMQLDKKNRWVRLADEIEWSKFEGMYAALFAPKKPEQSRTGRPAKPLRMVLDALIIQRYGGLSDRKLTQAIAENPYDQYFLGLERFQTACPFTAPALVTFRKRLTCLYFPRFYILF